MARKRIDMGAGHAKRKEEMSKTTRAPQWVSERVDEFRPKKPAYREVYEQEEVRNMAKRILAEREYESAASLDKDLRVLAIHLCCVYPLGTIDPNVILRDEYLERTLRDLDVARRTRADYYRRLAKLGEAWPGSGQRRRPDAFVGKQPAKAPYTHAEAMEFVDLLSKELPETESQTRALIALLLALGTGMRTAEICSFKRSQARYVKGHLVIDAKNRSIPVLADYADLLDASIAKMKPKKPMLSVGNRNNVPQKLFGSIGITERTLPELDRAVSTYRLRLIQTPLPFSTVMWLCNVKSSSALDGLLVYLPISPEAQLERSLNAAATSRKGSAD